MARTTDDRGRNVWHHVAADEHPKRSDDIAKLLFATKEVDAIVNAPDKQGQTPLHMSAYLGTVDIPEALLERRNIDLDAYEMHEGRIALHSAAADGDATFPTLY